MNDLYLNRAIEPTIKEASSYFPVISITGPRQSGKTTLLKHLFPAYAHFSMKDLNIRDFATNDPIAFLNQNDHMLIDEIQTTPILLEYIQGIVDNKPERRFAITGSSNFELLKGISESLAGRVGVFELLPMTLEESQQEEHAHNKSTDERLFDGFYPAVCAGKNVPHFFYPSYVKTYIERDVRDIMRIQNQSLFIKFIKMCAARTGSIFNAYDISNQLGIDSKTVKNWLSVLQASYLITLLPPYYENISKRLIKSPKLYFNDTGLLCYLLDIESPQQLGRDKMRGAIFENFIVMDIIKQRYNKGKDGGVFFYRDSNQNEVDILLKQEGAFTAIEIKSSMTYNKEFEKTVSKIDSWINAPVAQKAVVYAGDFENTSHDVKILRYDHLSSIL